MSARSWTVTIPAPASWLNSNDRTHGRARAGTVREWRNAGHMYARQAKLPALGKAHITATLRFRDKRKRDAGNYYPTAKAAIDGMVTDYGLLPDDSSEYLIGPDMRMGEPLPAKAGAVGCLVLVIREQT